MLKNNFERVRNRIKSSNYQRIKRDDSIRMSNGLNKGKQFSHGVFQSQNQTEDQKIGRYENRSNEEEINLNYANEYHQYLNEHDESIHNEELMSGPSKPEPPTTGTSKAINRAEALQFFSQTSRLRTTQTMRHNLKIRPATRKNRDVVSGFSPLRKDFQVRKMSVSNWPDTRPLSKARMKSLFRKKNKSKNTLCQKILSDEILSGMDDSNENHVQTMDNTDRNKDGSLSRPSKVTNNKKADFKRMHDINKDYF